MSNADVTVLSLSTACWGAEESLLTIASHAPAQIRIIAPAGELLERAQHRGLTTVRLDNEAVARCADIGRHVGPGALGRVLAAAVRALAAEHIWDAGPVVSFSQWLHLPLALAGRLRRRQVVLDLHDGPFTRAGAAIQAAAAFTASRNVATSRTALRHVGRWPRRRTAIVARPVEVPDGVSSSRVEDGVLRLSFVGRLDPEKGLPIALEAVARLNALGVPAVLDVVGGTHRGGEGQPQPEQSPFTIFHGRLPHTEALTIMAGSDLVLSMAPGEAFGRTVAEAALVGVPSVVVGGGPAELVTHGLTGWHTPPDDPVSLSRLLQGLAADGPARRAAGVAAHTALGALCDPDVVAAAWTNAVLRSVGGVRR